MTNLRQLLATWENWSAYDTLTRALAHAGTGEDEGTTQSLAETATSPLDALRESTELVELLTGWQWRAMYVARRDGASWRQIGTATRMTADQARASFATVLDRQETVLGRGVEAYRDMLRTDLDHLANELSD